MTDHSSKKPKHSKAKQYGTTEEFYDFLLNGLNDLAIYILSPTGIIQTWSKGAQTIKQYEAKEIEYAS